MMSDLQSPDGSTPYKGNDQEVSVQPAQKAEHNILSTLRDMLESVKDIHEDLQGVQNEVQTLGNNVTIIQQEVQSLREETSDASRKASDDRYQAQGVQQELHDLLNERLPISNTEDNGEYNGCVCDDEDHYDEDPCNNGCRRQFVDQVIEPLDEPLVSSGGWNESGESSGDGWGTPNGDNSDSLHEAAVDGNKQAVQEVEGWFQPWIDWEDPKNLKPIDDYHFAEFRAGMMEIEELARKFNQLPVDAFSKLREETKSLFVQVVTTVDKFQPKGANLSEFSNQPYKIVDTKWKVREMVDTLIALPINEPNIGVDLEGKSLGRDGPVYIAIVHDYKAGHTYIVDVHHLQAEAFEMSGTDETNTLRWILESKEIPKLFYDVRQDSDALYHQFGIELDGILDVQLFKLAASSCSFDNPNQWRTGLYRAISSGIDMTIEDKDKWLAIKYHGKKLWNPEEGGSWDCFTERDKSKEIIQYCLVDVVHLRTLYQNAVEGLSERWIARVKNTTERSIKQTWAEDFESSGAEGPW